MLEGPLSSGSQGLPHSFVEPSWVAGRSSRTWGVRGRIRGNGEGHQIDLRLLWGPDRRRAVSAARRASARVVVERGIRPLEVSR
jgi:hypothetical protein